MGVFGVVATFSIGLGARSIASQSIGALADKSFSILSASADLLATEPSLSPRQLAHIRAMPNVVSFVPYRLVHTVVYDDKRPERVSLQGEGSVQFVTESVAQGRNIEPDDITRQSFVAVITARGSKRLSNVKVGNTLRIKNQAFAVVGILENSFRAGFGPSTGDIYIPYTTFEQIFPISNEAVTGDGIVADPVQAPDTISKILEYLRKSSNSYYFYKGVSRADLNAELEKVASVVTISMTSVASVSALVSGIGIATTSLISIRARRGELAVRRAIGATRRRIVALIIGEALRVSLVGAAVGCAAGVAFTVALNVYGVHPQTGVWPAIPWVEVCVLAMSFALLVALTFALLPALRAATLDPLEALRDD
jgi:ABC-type antimicrobial peptide transport system permease subunit